MKTKRELLKHFAKCGNCEDMPCTDCPYYECSKHCPNDGVSFKRIGAMAILRMFPEKKKPTLQNLSRIRFSDGRFAMVITRPGDDKPLLDFGDKIQTLDYLFNRTWEIVEEC